MVGARYDELPRAKLRSFHVFEATTQVSINKYVCNFHTRTAQGSSNHPSHRDGRNKDNRPKDRNVREALGFP